MPRGPELGPPFPPRTGRNFRAGVGALPLPLTAFLGVFHLAPVALMLARAAGAETDFAPILKALSDDIVQRVFLGTLEMAAVATLAALVIGYPPALFAALASPWLGRLAPAAVLAPFRCSILLRSCARMVLLGREGLVNGALSGSGLVDQPLRLLNISLAVHVDMIHIALPSMILPIRASLKSIDGRLVRAAENLGAGTFDVLRLIVAPLSAPGVAAGALLLSPLAAPGIIVAIAVCFFHAPPGLVGSPIGMALARAALASPFVLVDVCAAPSGVDRRLEMAAPNLRASDFGAFRHLTFPVIRPGMAAGAVFAFIASFDEMIVAMFITSPGNVTLPIRMWESMRNELSPAIAAAASLIILLSIAFFLVAGALRRRAERRSAPGADA